MLLRFLALLIVARASFAQPVLAPVEGTVLDATGAVIPAAEVRREGRVAQWRVRIVWRGRVLDAQASPNWIG